MNRRQKLKVRTCLKSITLPTTLQSFLLIAGTDFTEWGSTTRPAAFMTSKPDHRPEDLIARIVVLEDLPKTLIG